MRKLAIFVILLTIAVAACATTVIPMSVEEMSRSADVVIYGRAIQTWSQWTPDHSMINTYTVFEVIRGFKGAPPVTITVKQMGGRLDGLEQKAAGVRQFSVGEERVLFLRPSMAADGSMVVVGLMQGNFRVLQTSTGTRVVSNAIPGVIAYDPAVRGSSEYRGSYMTLDQLEARVRKAVQQ